MSRLNSPGFSYTRTTTASRRAEQEERTVFAHVSVAFMPNPEWAPGSDQPRIVVDRAASRGTYRK